MLICRDRPKSLHVGPYQGENRVAFTDALVLVVLGDDVLGEMAGEYLQHQPVHGALGRGDLDQHIATIRAQLADTEHYSNDLTKPDIKALKTRCDAEKAAA